MDAIHRGIQTSPGCVAHGGGSFFGGVEQTIAEFVSWLPQPNAIAVNTFSLTSANVSSGGLSEARWVAARDGCGGTQEPREPGVAPTASLNGTRRSEKAEVLERAWTKMSRG